MIPQMLFNDNDFQDDFLLHTLDPKDDLNNSNGALTAISDESLPDLMDDSNFEGSEFLQSDNVGFVTPNHSFSEITPEKEIVMPIVVVSQKIKTVRTQSEKPTPFDVLCGQSRTCANHSGNKRFQATLDMYASKYDAAKSKQEKMTLTKEIVGRIADNGGRFLKFKSNNWVEIANVTARDKVSHALRTKVQSWKRQQASSSSKKAPSIRKRRHSRRASSAAPSLTECKAVSFDGSTASSTSVMDELLRTQREIFEKLTQSNEMHPLK
ncbi:unnamed protein product [Cylindrotheca closterium]|uniref:DUF6824 domain-containing protein n=1 Tax=Cylindrotheca closterium TaxID=2856 RepID=A0AAD2FCN7_9STRA|nr:unnamed protein product [Cylindrotheca closterium]